MSVAPMLADVMSTRTAAETFLYARASCVAVLAGFCCCLDYEFCGCTHHFASPPGALCTLSRSFVTTAFWTLRDGITKEGNRSLGKRLRGVELVHWDGELPSRMVLRGNGPIGENRLAHLSSTPAHTHTQTCLLRNQYYWLFPLTLYSAIVEDLAFVALAIDASALVLTPDRRKLGDWLTGLRAVVEHADRAERLELKTQTEEVHRMEQMVQFIQVSQGTRHQPGVYCHHVSRNNAARALSLSLSLSVSCEQKRDQRRRADVMKQLKAANLTPEQEEAVWADINAEQADTEANLMSVLNEAQARSEGGRMSYDEALSAVLDDRLEEIGVTPPPMPEIPGEQDLLSMGMIKELKGGRRSGGHVADGEHGSEGSGSSKA